MAGYTFVNSLDELKPWIKDEVSFDGTDIEARNRVGGIRERRVQEWLVYHGENLEVDSWYGAVATGLVENSSVRTACRSPAW